MDLIKPYFMTNKEWFTITIDGIFLTEEGKKIPKVVKSYNDFMKESDK